MQVALLCWRMAERLSPSSRPEAARRRSLLRSCVRLLEQSEPGRAQLPLAAAAHEGLADSHLLEAHQLEPLPSAGGALEPPRHGDGPSEVVLAVFAGRIPEVSRMEPDRDCWLGGSRRHRGAPLGSARAHRRHRRAARRLPARRRAAAPPPHHRQAWPRRAGDGAPLRPRRSIRPCSGDTTARGARARRAARACDRALSSRAAGGSARRHGGGAWLSARGRRWGRHSHALTAAMQRARSLAHAPRTSATRRGRVTRPPLPPHWSRPHLAHGCPPHLSPPTGS